MNLAADNLVFPAPLCTLLFLAVVLLGIGGLLEILGVWSPTARRYGLAIGFVVALVLYVVFC